MQESPNILGDFYRRYFYRTWSGKKLMKSVAVHTHLTEYIKTGDSYENSYRDMEGESLENKKYVMFSNGVLVQGQSIARF